MIERTVDDVRLGAADVVPYLRRRMHARELYTYQVNGYRSFVQRVWDHRHDRRRP